MLYDQRLKSFDLFTLFQRHQHGDLIEIFKIVKGYYDINPGVILEISLSSFQAACLSWTHTVRSSRRVSSDTATQIFAKVSNFPSWQPKKRSSLHFLNFESKQRPVNTASQSAVYAS